MSPTQIKRYLYDIVIDDFKFEGPDSFTHLGSVLGNGNKTRTVIISTMMRVKKIC